MTDVPLFDVPEEPRKRARRVSQDRRPVYTRITAVKRERCDDCLADLAEGRSTSAAHLSVYKRRAGDDVSLLCYNHTVAQREADGLGPLPKEGRR